MRLATLTANGFRNLQGAIAFPHALTLLVGGNNSGKSNVVDALRILSPPRAGMQHSRWLTMDDFRHGADGAREVDTLELSATFVDLSSQERDRLVTCLSPTLGAGTAQLRVVAEVGPRDHIKVAWYGGESLQPGVEQWARETIQHTYLHPLRDASADLRPGRDNKLVRLLGSLAPASSDARAEIEAMAQALNSTLESTNAIARARTEIQDRLDRMAGPTFAQRTGLKFSETRFERVIAALRALAGDVAPLELLKNGLGYNNLLYMATLLAAIGNDSPDEGTHLLLVEEPEAHLHPQLQDLLLRFLRNESGASTQVIVTTHSPIFAAASGVEQLTVMVSPSITVTGPSSGRTPAHFGIGQSELNHLRRFLDATKASLLFARGVILVEGIAEQLLMPQLAEYLGFSLAEAGVSIVNVGGLSFAPFASLFSSDRLPCRCSIVSDGDAPEMELQLANGDAVLSATATKIKAMQTDSMRVFLSRRTFEWDLVAAGNWEEMIRALALVKPVVAARLRASDAGTTEGRADALLGAIVDVKGRFAQALTQILTESGPLTVPPYLEQALRWAVGQRAA